jgi:P27 family predicted phage terminase small subunit
MGRRGPRPKPTALRLLDGRLDVTAHRTINPAEPELSPGTDSDWKRPEDLRLEAAKEWERLTQELRSAGVLTLADRAVFETYCRAWGDLRKFEKLCRRVGPADAVRLGYQGMVLKMRQQVRQLAAEFGLTAASRSGVKAKKPELPGKLGRFIGGGKA